MIIRGYRPADRTAVLTLFRAFMKELTPPRLEREFAAYVENAVRDELGRIDEYYLSREGQGFWVAEEDEVIGMVGVERHDEALAEVRRMAVQASHRRRGVARALLGTAEEFCRQARYRKLILSTSELQVAARYHYEKTL